MADQKGFIFIDQSNQGKVSTSKTTRRQIRKQAMRDAGQARRQRGGYGQHNLRQYPVYVGTGESNSSTSLAGATYSTDDDEVSEESMRDLWQVSLWHDTIPTKMPIGQYEKLRRDLGFDITELSLLTTLAFARGAARALASQPSQLAGLLVSSNSSYLNFIPARYEDSPVLHNALFCVAAQSRWLLQPLPRTTESAILGAYGNALQTLQEALVDPEACLHPDVLCATQVLGLFEVLKFSRAERWQYHVAGASQIIQTRGPGRFKSNYEMALLTSHMGAIFSEAILNNEVCFLDQPEWHSVFDGLVLHNVTPFEDRSFLSVELWRALWNIPRLFKDTTELICHRTEPDPGFAMELTLRAYQIRTKLKKWDETAEIFRSEMPDTLTARAQARELMGLCLAMQILVGRLIVSLSPFKALSVEEENQRIALSILGIKKETMGEPGTRRLLLSQRFAIANSAIQTQIEWEEACRHLIAASAIATSAEWEGEVLRSQSEQRNLSYFECGLQQHSGTGVTGGIRNDSKRTVIPKWVFERWCQTLGRKTSLNS